MVLGARTAFAPAFTHCGHCTPTTASFMQRAQIGSPQRWHRTYAVVSGWFLHTDGCGG
jgi:hypothetical protein